MTIYHRVLLGSVGDYLLNDIVDYLCTYLFGKYQQLFTYITKY